MITMSPGRSTRSSDAGVMTGLLHWLGRTDLERVEPASDQVPQNPRELAEKVENFDEMQAALAAMDPFQSRRLPSFEPRRGPAVPSFVAADAGRGLLFMPVRGGPSEVVGTWLRGLGPVTGGDVDGGQLVDRLAGGHVDLGLALEGGDVGRLLALLARRTGEGRGRHLGGQGRVLGDVADDVAVLVTAASGQEQDEGHGGAEGDPAA